MLKNFGRLHQYIFVEKALFPEGFCRYPGTRYDLPGFPEHMIFSWCELSGSKGLNGPTREMKTFREKCLFQIIVKQNVKIFH